MTRSTLILSLLLLAGCQTYDLGDQYKPLSKIVERPSLKTFGVSDTLMSTKGSHVYVAKCPTCRTWTGSSVRPIGGCGKVGCFRLKGDGERKERQARGACRLIWGF